MDSPHLHIHADHGILNHAVATRLLQLARDAAKKRGSWHWALAGGSTPKSLYELLASEPYASQMPWERIHIWFGDERYVPADDPRSNYRMARETLLSKVPLADAQVHPIPVSGADAPGDAHDYAELMRDLLPAGGGDMPVLDAILLGLGPDGHTASLFPETPILQVRDTAAAAVYVPKLSAWRISVTIPVIEQARHVLFLAAGEEKAPITATLFGSDERPRSASRALPVQMINGRGEVEWHLDRRAAARLHRREQA
ncbi:MAG: 6-phosphogluconolactonase [Gammaproteobacteria bacterium]